MLTNPRTLSLLMLLMLLMILCSCGGSKKPVTAVGAALGCGPMPPKVMLCLQTLPRTPDGKVDRARVSPADLERCYVNSVDQLISENDELRIRYAPCAR